MKDNLLKYIDLQKDFRGKATEIEISIRQSNRVIERLAPHLSSYRPKDSKEIERNDFLKDFCIKVAQTNECVISALNSFRITFEEIVSDIEVIRASQTNNIIQDQSEIIEEFQKERDLRIKNSADEIRRKLKTTI